MISYKLKELRECTGMNKKEFAAYLGIKYTTYNNYETGTREPASGFLILISKKLNVSIDYIMGLTNEKEKNYSYKLKPSEITHIKKYRTLDGHGKEVVDVVLDKETERMQTLTEQAEEDDEDNVIEVDFSSLKASAGNGFDLYDAPTDKLRLFLNDKTRQADICIKVDGHSMEPVFNDGDILLVHSQPAVDVGEYGVFVINDEGYVKKQGPDRLISVNDEYDDIYPHEYDNVRCCGKVIGVLDENWIVE